MIIALWEDLYYMSSLHSHKIQAVILWILKALSSTYIVMCNQKWCTAYKMHAVRTHTQTHMRFIWRKKYTLDLHLKCNFTFPHNKHKIRGIGNQFSDKTLNVTKHWQKCLVLRKNLFSLCFSLDAYACEFCSLCNWIWLCTQQ